MKEGYKLILINLGIMTGLLIIGCIYLFYIYLPNVTHHGETISVPDLRGMHKSEIEEFLEQHSLKYEIIDSLSFEKSEKPDVVISQRPKFGTMVKEFRKIYVSVNASKVPEVVMPSLTNTSLFNATTIINNNGLVLDSIKYKISKDAGLVLLQEYQGKEIEPGTKIKRGSIITLTVGKKGEVTQMEMPDFIGMPIVLVKRKIEELGLLLGNPIWDERSNEDKNTVFKQKPEAGETISSDQFVDIWVSGTEPEEQKEK